MPWSPEVTAPEAVLQIPAGVVKHFATLDDLLRRAISEAHAGRFLGPPTQPEIDEMRTWICSEVAKQTSGTSTATPWVARTDVRATLADQEHLTATYASLALVDQALLATDEASIIVAASSAALELLGYDRAEDLLGRRVIAVVPARYHQAHIAGTTLNATNGRDVLLGVPLVVPMVRADGGRALGQHRGPPRSHRWRSPGVRRALPAGAGAVLRLATPPEGGAATFSWWSRRAALPPDADVRCGGWVAFWWSACSLRSSPCGRP